MEVFTRMFLNSLKADSQVDEALTEDICQTVIQVKFIIMLCLTLI